MHPNCSSATSLRWVLNNAPQIAARLCLSSAGVSASSTVAGQSEMWLANIDRFRQKKPPPPPPFLCTPMRRVCFFTLYHAQWVRRTDWTGCQGGCRRLCSHYRRCPTQQRVPLESCDHASNRYHCGAWPVSGLSTRGRIFTKKSTIGICWKSIDLSTGVDRIRRRTAGQVIFAEIFQPRLESWPKARPMSARDPAQFGRRCEPPIYRISHRRELGFSVYCVG